MKKLLFLLFLIPSSLFAGLSQTNQTYRDETTIRREFNNIYMNAQSKQFAIFRSTPNLNELQDGQMVIVSSINKGIAWRDGTTVNFLTSSGTLYQTNYVTVTSNTYISIGVTRIVAGANITITPSGGTGEVTINSSGGGGGTGTLNINFDELEIVNSATQINFKGSGVSVTQSGSTATVTILGGSGGGVSDGSNAGDLTELDDGGSIVPSLVTFANDVNSDLDQNNQIMFKPYVTNAGEIIIAGVWGFDSSFDFQPMP